MDLCSDGHDEICYESGYGMKCPACKMMEEHEEEIADLNKSIESLGEDAKATIEEFNTYRDFYDSLVDDYPEYII